MGGCGSRPKTNEGEEVPAPEPVKEEPLPATGEGEVVKEANKEQSLGSLLDEKEEVAVVAEGEKKEEAPAPPSGEEKLIAGLHALDVPEEKVAGTVVATGGAMLFTLYKGMEMKHQRPKNI